MSKPLYEQLIAVTTLNLYQQRVLIRADLNVPMQDGHITSEARVEASLATIKFALQAGAKVMVTSHLGRPQEGIFSAENSLQAVTVALQNKLNCPVRLVRDWLTVDFELAAGELVVLENCRFNLGEKANSETLARQYAALCDVFVMDAFATAHRAEASTTGVAKFAPIAVAGVLLIAELKALSSALHNPIPPLVAIVGGSKVSTKLMLLENLADKVDQLIVGGGIANTFLKAAGFEIGNSLYEKDLLPTAKMLINKMTARGATVPLATDVVCSKTFSATATAQAKRITAVEADDLILDIGAESAALLCDIIAKAGTIVWNGPMGVFEFDQFGKGTQTIAEAIANSHAYTVAGGGDTIAAIEKYGISERLSYISTAGGAFLEFLEGKTLPAVAVLAMRAQELRRKL